jgi:AbrB family looped-hinge helix DNA binding protein
LTFCGVDEREVFHPQLAPPPKSFYDAAIDMDTVTLSPKFQVVIPLAIREALKLTPGEKFRVLQYADRVEFIPVREMKEMRGYLRGMDTAIDREDERL